jgi:hypothetical protein
MFSLTVDIYKTIYNSDSDIDDISDTDDILCDYDNFSQSDQQLILNKIKECIENFKYFCVDEINTYKDSIFDYLRSRVNNAEIMIHKTKIDFIFDKKIDFNKMSNSMSIEVCSGYFSDSDEIVLSDGNHILMINYVHEKN